MLLYLFLGFITTFICVLAMHKDNSFHKVNDGPKIATLVTACLMWFWFMPLSVLLRLVRNPVEPKSKWWAWSIWIIWAGYATYLGGFIG